MRTWIKCMERQKQNQLAEAENYGGNFYQRGKKLGLGHMICDEHMPCSEGKEQVRIVKRTTEESGFKEISDDR